MDTEPGFREDAFPFLLAVDEALALRRVGPLMRRVLPGAREGASLPTLFALRNAPQAPTHALLRSLGRRSVIMDALHTDPALIFKGEWYCPPGQSGVLYFLGWPWLLDSEELTRLGLSLKDIPAHNPLGDMLVLLRSCQNTLADTRELAERLRQRSNDLRQANQQLQHLAHFDPLTQMPNRVLLGDRLRQAMLHCQRRNACLAVVYLDLDGFKPINDRHGHAVGDQLLMVLALRLKEVLREDDTLARIGGDEFVAVLADLQQPSDCEPVLQRLLQAARVPVPVGALSLQISTSIGVTYYPHDSADADLLLRHADQAMYLAKQAGKNRFHEFDIAHDAAVATRHEGLEHLRQALHARQFVLHYQPQVDLARGRAIGVEALIRWQHPQRGLLPPAQFLPLLDGHPMALSLGEWVLQTALAQLTEWNAQGLALEVSVNVDPEHLQSAHFVPWLSALLAQHPGVRPGQLTLEVLESCALEDVKRAGAALRASQALGVHSALDDFGTGYSSLLYLKRLPAHTLKIDRSFVSGMLDAADDRAIVQAVISLAHAFGRNVVAEGVEHAAQAHALHALGCTRIQGFGIARPMPAQAVADWVRQFQPGPDWQPSPTRLRY
ncbi:MAG: putative bifunctional diguanylate cyclase/phosphodiesterase [Rhodoferax sp.]